MLAPSKLSEFAAREGTRAYNPYAFEAGILDRAHESSEPTGSEYG
jgi:hypothetical protein